MDKNKILQTLRDMQEIAERLENICEAQGISWGTSSMLSVGDLNLDHPEKTSIQLSWTMWGPYNSPPENESVYIPLSLLWDEEAIPRLLKARAEKRRQEKAKDLQRELDAAKKLLQKHGQLPQSDRLIMSGLAMEK